MRVLVCGGRDFTDVKFLKETLNNFHATRPITCVIHGMARGADSLGGAWAASQGIERAEFPADWKKHGRAAGPIRNKQMLDEGKPDIVVAFPGGKGTANMIKIARGAGVLVIEPQKGEK